MLYPLRHERICRCLSNYPSLRQSPVSYTHLTILAATLFTSAHDYRFNNFAFLDIAAGDSVFNSGNNGVTDTCKTPPGAAQHANTK